MSEVIAAHGKVRVILSDECGEGIGGDYDPRDPQDIPLMRFEVQRHDPKNIEAGEDGWYTLSDASYCTQIDARLPAEEHKRLAVLLLQEVYEPASVHGNVKKLCEHLSWINPTWGTANEKQGWVLP